MKTKILAFFLLFSFATLPLTQANAAPKASSERYFVKSTANLWKNSFSARNIFEGGFTADLTDWQLRAAKIFKVEVEPVTKYYVSPEEIKDVVISGNPESPKPDARMIPDSQVPWGIAAIHSDPDLEESVGGDGITIAVLDTGVLKSHPDLVNRIADCKDFTMPKISSVNGKCDDRNGHGTHVAGIIAADGGKDGLGIYGVAPEAKVLAFKVCEPNGSCWADDIATAMHTAVDAGVEIINLSLGADRESILITEAVNYAADHDVLIVAAAGNDGDLSNGLDYPAANPRVVAVGALDEEFAVPDWSSRGSNSQSNPEAVDENDIEFVAPGVNVESTWKDGYAILSGTSMAAPHVAGLAALLWDTKEKNPAEAVREYLRSHTEDVGDTGEDDDSGFGLPLLK